MTRSRLRNSRTIVIRRVSLLADERQRAIFSRDIPARLRRLFYAIDDVLPLPRYPPRRIPPCNESWKFSPGPAHRAAERWRRRAADDRSGRRRPFARSTADASRILRALQPEDHARSRARRPCRSWPAPRGRVIQITDRRRMVACIERGFSGAWARHFVGHASAAGFAETGQAAALLAGNQEQPPHFVVRRRIVKHGGAQRATRNARSRC